MATAPLSDELAREALDALAAHGTVTAAAIALGINRSTFDGRVLTARQRQLRADQSAGKGFELADLPSELPTADELIARRKQQFARKSAAKEARKLIPVQVALDGPIGICHFGDPHVDDNGTDLDKLQSHLDICNRTEGLFAACVGDYSNNWVGRLARLYGEQSVSAAEAWVLVEWLIGATDWIYLVGGNHDAWSGAGDPIQWIAKHKGQQYEMNGARLGVTMPDGRVFRISARHEFPGSSMYNAAHGPAKAALTGHRDHVLTCGHQHTSGYNVLKDPMTGLITHALRVASYKTYDRYADEKGLRDQNIFCAPVTLLDSRFADDDVRAVTVIMDPAEGADYLTWKRKKWARGSRVA